MTSRVYRSKIGPGYLALVAMCLTVMYGSLWQTWDVGGAAANAFGAGIAALVSLVLLGSFNTRYWIEGSALHVRSFVFRWTIPVGSIVRITSGHNFFTKGPALSFNRIEIWYRGGTLLISPRRRRDFLTDLARTRASLGLEPIRGIRA